MNRFRWLMAILPILLAIAFMPEALATGSCGTLPSSVSSLTLYCIPANIVNSQGSATPSGFQQMLTFNALNYSSYLSGNLENIYVYNSLSGAQMPAWIEGNALNEQQTTSLNTAANVVVWVNLGANTIPASGFANQYAIGIGSTSTDFFVSGNGIGEAPQLSSTYAEYDNGASVFTYYQNFAGTALPSGWTTGLNIAYTINNGLLDAYINGGTGNGYIATSATYSTADVVDWFGNLGSSNANWAVGGYVTDSGTFYGGAGFGFQGSTVGLATGNPSATTATSMTYAFSTNSVFTTTIQGTTAYQSIDYGAYTSTSTDLPSSSTLGVGVYLQTLPSNGYNLYWIRVRTYPPSGVMPSVSFGAAASVSIISLSISPNPNPYGATASAIASCTPSTDTCAVDSPLGTHLCTGTGSCIYTIPILSPGTTAYYANDLTNQNTATVNYVVSSGVLAYSLNNCTNEDWTISGGGYSCTTTGTFSYPTNQLAAEQQTTQTLKLNGESLGATTANTASVSNTISNTILQACYTFATTAESANFVSGNAVPVCWIGYTPLYVADAASQAAATPKPSASVKGGNVISDATIPWKFYTKSPSNTITFNLNQSTSAGAWTAEQSKALNVSWIVGNAYSTGTVVFGANESQPNNPLSTPIVFNQTLGVNSIVFNSGACTPGLTSRSTPLEYFPLEANALVRNCWYSPPSSYTIDGYTNSSGANVIITKGSNTLALAYNLRASYNMFTPAYSFNLTAASGAGLASIPLEAGCGSGFFEAANAVPAAPCTRIIFNISTYNQHSLKPLDANTTLSTSALINNYSISNQTTYSANTFKIYMPFSAFQNPNISTSQTTTYSTSSGFFLAVNNYCNHVYSSSQYGTLKPYLIDANGSLYTVNIYSGYSTSGGGDYLWVMDGISNASAINVQQYRITSSPFALALENGNSYAFRFYNSNCGFISSSNYSVWTNPITLNIPQNTTVPTIPTANVVTSCTESYLTQNTMSVTCTGSDTADLVTSWTITAYNLSAIRGWTAFNSFNESTSAFTQVISPLSNSSPLLVTVSWAGAGIAGSEPFHFNQNIIIGGLSVEARGFVILLALLVGIGIGAAGSLQSPDTAIHAPSTTIFVEALIIAVLFMTGVMNFIPNYLIIGLLLLMVFIGVQAHANESGGE